MDEHTEGYRMCPCLTGSELFFQLRFEVFKKHHSFGCRISFGLNIKRVFVCALVCVGKATKNYVSLYFERSRYIWSVYFCIKRSDPSFLLGSRGQAEQTMPCTIRRREAALMIIMDDLRVSVMRLL